MGKIVKRIVLTGGPCAGKSSSLELIENYLRKKGYIVYTVQESATELINSGIKPFGEDNFDLVKFQEIILKYQLDKELLIDNVASSFETDKEIVIIYDRGLIDNKAYIGQKTFNRILEEYNLDEIDIIDRYDLVIHLETAAKSEGYTKENNKARSEDKDSAIAMDNKTFEAWRFHKNLVRVKCKEDFEEKQREILGIVDNALSKNVRVQNKYLISDFKFNGDDEEVFYITQYYFDSDDNLEYRLREVKYKNKNYYYYTVQRKMPNGLSNVLLDQRIDIEKFQELLGKNTIKKEVSKIRKYVVINDKKYSIDIFNDGTVLLECVEEIGNIDFGVSFDVTSDDKYLNQNTSINGSRLLLNK